MKLCLYVRLSKRSIAVHSDNTISIFLVKNLTYHVNTKHIDIHYHFDQDMVEDGKVILQKLDTLENLVDVLMKLMSIGKFKLCCESMGLMALNSQLIVCCVLPYTFTSYITSGRILRHACHTTCGIVNEKVIVMSCIREIHYYTMVWNNFYVVVGNNFQEVENNKGGHDQQAMIANQWQQMAKQFLVVSSIQSSKDIKNLWFLLWLSIE